MTQQQFFHCESDLCVYYKRLRNGEFFILLLYVDDMLVVGTSMRIVNELKHLLALHFSMKDLGAANKILGMNIIRDRNKRELKLSQENYIYKVLAKFNMSNAKPIGTPLADHFHLSSAMCLKTPKEKAYVKTIPSSSTIGSLMYTMICTRSDIAHVVGVVSIFMSNLGKTRWHVVK